MSITVPCSCGESYDLKDEFAGKVVQCPKCGNNIRAESGAGIAPQADPAFNRDKFLLRQKHLAISEKYYVWNEQGQTILYVERPAHLLRNLGAIFAGIIAGIAFGVIFGILASVARPEVLQILLGIIAGLGGLAAIFVVGIALSAKRHITFYRDDSRKERLMEVLQDKKVQIINATYTIRDPDSQVLARLHKNYFYNLLRKRWYCYAPDGAVLCMAKEDSIILSLMRRLIGPLFGILRANFIILDARQEKVIGEFNRNFTILDRYVLDMKSDPKRLMDRRIALALGVMLDTGERR